MLAVNATLVERVLAVLPSRAPAVAPDGDAGRLLALGVSNVYDHRGVKRSAALARGSSHGRRDVARVGAIVLHQTASGYLHAGHPRLLGTPAHAVVHRNGAVSLLHDLTAYCYHAHALNRFSIGIEVDCREPGLLDDPTTFPREDDQTIWRRESERGRPAVELSRPLTSEQVDATRALARWYADELARRGGRLLQCWAHRQGRGDRTSDPGEAVWRRIALPTIDELGLNDVDQLTLGGGHRIPREWGAQTNARYAD